VSALSPGAAAEWLSLHVERIPDNLHYAVPGPEAVFDTTLSIERRGALITLPSVNTREAYVLHARPASGPR